MKKVFYLCFSLMLFLTLAGCKTKKIELKFMDNEITIKSGEAVKITEELDGVSYKIANNKYDDVKIDENTGVITFTTKVPNYTQLIVYAEREGITSNPCIVTLVYDYQTSEISFTNKSEYIASGDYVNAVSSLDYAVTYSLKNEVKGVSIDSESGKVEYSPIVEDNTIYTVVANSHGSKSEKEFKAIINGFVLAKTSRQALAKNDKKIPAIYPLDFTNSDVEKENGVITVVNSLNEELDKKYYTYNVSKSQIEISASYVDELDCGEHVLKIVTPRNTISVKLIVVTKFIYTVEELVEINETIENLSGYYILMKDIDLTEYLSKTGDGYNDGKGWTPIGSYKDTLDSNVATQYSFKGTFDGNGHVITGLFANRKDEASFNAGLFGYITSSATIRNLGVTGNLTVSSYSGGLVGSNNGLIENCWANVNMNVESGENAYRFVGGFAGNNFGRIQNCYSIGKVSCDNSYGAFVGSNEGIIENCYSYKQDNCKALLGAGVSANNSEIFENLEKMEEFDFEKIYSSDNWSFKSKLPTLIETLDEYSVREITLELNDYYFQGDKIDLKTNIYPFKLNDEYKDLITYTVIGDGAFKLKDSVVTDNTADVITIRAELIVDDVLYISEKEIDIRIKIDEITFDSKLKELEVGKSYLLKADYLPLNAEEKIEFRLNANYLGAQINGNILTIDEEYKSSSKITIIAYSEAGCEKSLEVNVKKHQILDEYLKVIYEDTIEDIEFTFNENLNLDGVKVNVFGRNVNCTIIENKIKISKEIINDFKDQKIKFIFVLSDNSVYTADVYYYSHNKYKLENFNVEDVILINSVEDFYKYFNASTQEEWSKDKLNNYDKTFILTKDLDFGGAALYGIGTSETKFSGKFYGMGHTISNFVITKSERFCINEQKESEYGVGLFANVSTGEFYDIKITNAKVRGKNFAGALIGLITDGIVENCVGYELDVVASDYSYSLEDVYVGKIVGRNYNGKISSVYYNGITINAIG